MTDAVEHHRVGLVRRRPIYLYTTLCAYPADAALHSHPETLYLPTWTRRTYMTDMIYARALALPVRTRQYIYIYIGVGGLGPTAYSIPAHKVGGGPGGGACFVSLSVGRSVPLGGSRAGAPGGSFG